MRRLRLAVVVLVLVACCCLGMVLLRRTLRPAPEHPRGTPIPRPQPRLEGFPQQPPLEAPRAVVVYKARRALVLYLQGERHAAYPIGLGSNPVGHKQREGDGRTPEGRYYVCTRNPRSRFHLFLGLSYPSTRDAEKARRAGLISPAEFRNIRDAVSGKRSPPWNTALGGEIGIHGGGAGSDWTTGCIAMENADVEVVWSHLRVGDPVVILP